MKGHVVAPATTALLAASTILLTIVSGSGPGAARREPKAAGDEIYVPASAHAAGANGASWRTDVELHNPGTTTAYGTLALLVRDANNSAPETRSFTLGAQQSLRYVDVLMTQFSFTGAAALRVDVSSGAVLVTSRTYNQIGANPWGLPEGASFGQFVPGYARELAIAHGEEGRLIHLSQRDAAALDGFRTNLGAVNATAGAIDVRVSLFRADGTPLGDRDVHLEPYGFRQLDQVFASWGSVSDGYAVVRTSTPGGRFHAFATVIDNHTSGDPIFVPAVKTSAATPTPTATVIPPTATATAVPPTATPTNPPGTATFTPTTPSGGRPNLFLHKPSGWQSCLSAHYQSGCCSGTSCCSPFLSTYYSAFLSFFVANSGTATLTGPVRVALAIDGVVTGHASWANASGLEPGFGTILTWEYTGQVAAGTHTLTLTLDPDATIAETNEADNSCSSTATWTSIVFREPEARLASTSAVEAELLGGAVVRLDAGARPLAADAAGTVYIPATAHASGANGASWRTDVEVHNPGATEAVFVVALLKQGADNSGPESKMFSISPQRSVRYVDVLSSLFGFTGAAALRFTPTTGTILVNSRTYNLVGENPWSLPVGASFSQFVPGLPAPDAIGYGQEGRLVQLTHRDAASLVDFRTNIGFVNTTGSPLDLRVDLFDASGRSLATLPTESLAPYEFRQLSAVCGAYTSWLADGYAVIRTTTPGGSFFAFATVIDNHYSGDPIFIPATRLSASTGPTATSTPVGATPTRTATPAVPTPTPTRTPTPIGPTPTATRTPTPSSGTPSPTPITGTQPLGTIETINDIMTGLGLAGTGGKPTLETAVSDLQTRGIEAIITDAVNRYPTRVTRVPNGVRVDYGSGFTLDDGTVLTGQVTATHSNLSVTSTKVSGTVAIAFTNYTKNGGYTTVQDAAVSVNLNVTSQRKVSGEVSINASGTSPIGTTTVRGSPQVDTSVCLRYPVGGSVTVERGSETKRITFTPACDGTFVFEGAGYSPYLFEGHLLKCDGSPQAYSDKISLAVEGNHLTVNPTCGTTGGPKWHKVTGTRTATSARLVFRSTFPGDRTHVYEGVFLGTSSNGGTSYSGTSTFSVTVYESNGSVACTSPPYQKQGTLWLNTAAPCWP